MAAIPSFENLSLVSLYALANASSNLPSSGLEQIIFSCGEEAFVQSKLAEKLFLDIRMRPTINNFYPCFISNVKSFNMYLSFDGSLSSSSK
jgi:hypothetical protein